MDARRRAFAKRSTKFARRQRGAKFHKTENGSPNWMFLRDGQVPTLYSRTNAGFGLSTDYIPRENYDGHKGTG